MVGGWGGIWKLLQLPEGMTAACSRGDGEGPLAAGLGDDPVLPLPQGMTAVCSGSDGGGPLAAGLDNDPPQAPSLMPLLLPTSSIKEAMTSTCSWDCPGCSLYNREKEIL